MAPASKLTWCASLLVVFGLSGTLIALAQGRQQPPVGPEPGCQLVPPQTVQAVIGPFTQVIHTGRYIEGGEVPGVVKVFETNMMTCAFRKANGELLQIIGYWYPSTDDANNGFVHASKGASKGVPYFTSGSKHGSAQFFEGKGRSLGLLGQRVVIVHWLIMAGNGVEPMNVPGSRLTTIALAVLCPHNPDCKM